MDRCKCWGKTRITLEIEHCPSLKQIIASETDKMVQYALNHTDLSKFGKPHFSLAEFTIGDQNDVPSLPAKADASSLPTAQ